MMSASGIIIIIIIIIIYTMIIVPISDECGQYLVGISAMKMCFIAPLICAK